MNLPELPEGATLDTAGLRDGLPALPEGATLDSAPSGPPPQNSFLDKLGRAWENPPSGFSLIGAAKAAYEGLKAPGRALAGEYETVPEVPGQLSEADVERSRMAKEREVDDATKLAAALNVGSMPGGVFGGPSSSTIGMNFAPKGEEFSIPQSITSGRIPLPPSGVNPEVLSASQRLGVDLPRYLVDESRMTQGLAEGLKNIPGVGDKIARSAEETIGRIGSRAEEAQSALGAGERTVAGEAVRDALNDWIARSSGRGDTISSRIYRKVDDLINPNVTSPLVSTRMALKDIAYKRAQASLPETPLAKIVGDAAESEGLTYDGLKTLRTYFGDMTPTEMAVHGIGKTEAKQIYAALSNDLRLAVKNAGGTQALKAFEKANSTFSQIIDRQDAIKKLIGKEGERAPEGVFASIERMAGQGASADINKLRLLRKAVGNNTDAWNEIASGILGRIGYDPTGNFSINRFITGYSKLSPEAKNILFKTGGQNNVSRALDDILTVSQGVQDKLNRFYNPSGTAKSLASTEFVLSLIHNPLKALGTVVGGDKISRVLTEPVSARATADWVKAYRESLVSPVKGDRAFKNASQRLADLLVKQYAVAPQDLNAILQMPGASAPQGRAEGGSVGYDELLADAQGALKNPGITDPELRASRSVPTAPTFAGDVKYLLSGDTSGKPTAIARAIREPIESVGTSLKNIMSGGYYPGLRREDVTDIPPPQGPTKDSTLVGRALGLAPQAWEPNREYIGDTANVAAAVMSGAPATAVEGAAGMAGGKLGRESYEQLLARQRGAEGLRAAMRDPQTGKVYTGYSHQAAIESVPKSDTTGAWGRLSSEWDRETPNTGFIDRSGNFISRDEAEKRFGVSTMEDIRDLRKGTTLGSGATDERGRALASGLEAAAGANAPPFYSAVERAVGESPQASAPGWQWLGMLRNKPGVKPEELEWTGLQDWLQAKGPKTPVTRDELNDFLASNRVEMQEVTKGVPTTINPEEVGRSTYENYVRRGYEPPGSWENLSPEDRLNWSNYASKYSNHPDPPKFASYQLPGGENYREMLFTMPQKAADERAYSSSHWDEPNVLAHVRFNDRDINGKRTLFVEEVQSDWHQAGRKKGYMEPFQEAEPRKYTLNDFDVLKNSNGVYEVKLKSDSEGLSNGLPWAHSNEWGYSMSFDDFVKDVIKELNEKSATRAEAINQKTLDLNKGRVPNAPLKSDWPSMVMKRMIRYASDNGYDQIAWTSGATQVGRYDLSKQVSAIRANKNPDGTFQLGIQPIGRNMQRYQTEVPADKLADHVGKELAEKIMKEVTTPGVSNGKVFDGLDLKVGGEGMKAFYDRELPQRVNKIAKKFNARTQSGATLMTPEGRESVHVLPLTPELKGVAQREGFSLFAKGGRAMGRGAQGAKGVR